MRVAFFGQSGPYAPVALRQLLAGAGPYQIALVVEGRRRLADRVEHRVFKPHPAPLPAGENLKDIACAAGVPVLQTSEVNDAGAVRRIAEHHIDTIVCVGFDRLFRPPLLATARLGAINAHPSPLPQLRGPSPIFWALKEGRRELAVTVHGIDAREDHGPIYGSTPFVMPSAASGEQIYRLAGRVAGTLLGSVLARMAASQLVGIPQDDARATRAPRPKPEDALVRPSEWDCGPLRDFACGAPFFRTPWLRFDDQLFFVRRGLDAERGRRAPVEYALQGSTLVVRCRDGVVHFEVQT